MTEPGTMSDRLRQWLTSELQARAWSHRELGRQSGLSQTIISKVLLGKRNPTAEFCIKVAQALDAPPEMVLRLAGILPPAADSDSNPDVSEIAELARNLPPKDRAEALKYLRYLYQNRERD